MAWEGFKVKSIMSLIGEEAVLDQIAEEAAELAQAALKLARKKRGVNPTPKSEDACLVAFLEEIADLEVVLNEWLRNAPPGYVAQINSTMEYKEERWEARVDGKAENCD